MEDRKWWVQALETLIALPQHPPFTLLFPYNPNALFSLNLSTLLDLSLQPIQKWSLINMSGMDKISWFVPYSHDANTILHILHLSLVWQHYTTSINVTQDSRSSSEWALLITCFTQFPYPCFKPLLITPVNTLEYNSLQYMDFFFPNVYQHFSLYQNFHVILFL